MGFNRTLLVISLVLIFVSAVPVYRDLSGFDSLYYSIPDGRMGPFYAMFAIGVGLLAFILVSHYITRYTSSKREKAEVARMWDEAKSGKG